MDKIKLEWEFNKGDLVEIVDEGLPPGFTYKKPYKVIKQIILHGEYEGIIVKNDLGEKSGYIESYFEKYSDDLKPK